MSSHAPTLDCVLLRQDNDKQTNQTNTLVINRGGESETYRGLASIVSLSLCVCVRYMYYYVLCVCRTGSL